jgi:hypothetical protein
MSLHAYALRAEDGSKLDALPAVALVYVREPLSRAEIANLARWLHARPGSTLRVDSGVGELLDGLPLPRALELGRGTTPPDDAAPFERVERVTFAGARHVARWLRHLPNVRSVRIALHGDQIDAAGVATANLAALSLAEGYVSNLAALTSCANLQTLELREVTLDDFAPAGGLRELRSLRLCAVANLASIDALRAHAHLESLWLERLPFLRSLSDLSSLPAIESLAMSALWQFGMDDAEVVFELPKLRRATIDIGGTRKNVEILKRLRLPPAPPFSFEGERSD